MFTLGVEQRVARIASRLLPPTRVAKKVYLYHGTHPRNLRRVQSQGLIPDPKVREWADDPYASYQQLSRTSFPGIYLTANLMTARSSAERSSPRKAVIVVVRVETRTLLPDEDELTYSFMHEAWTKLMGQEYSMNEWSGGQAYIMLKQGKMDERIDDAVERTLTFWLREMEEGKTKEEIKEAARDSVGELVRVFLERQIAYIMKYEEETEGSWKKVTLGLEEEGLADDVPTAKDAEREFRRVLERVMRHLSKLTDNTERFNYTSRAPEAINFKGANKIVAIVSYDDDERETLDHPQPVHVHYVSDSAALKMLMKDWEQSVGKLKLIKAR